MQKTQKIKLTHKEVIDLALKSGVLVLDPDWPFEGRAHQRAIAKLGNFAELVRNYEPELKDQNENA